jgi:hypothetical protein
MKKTLIGILSISIFAFAFANTSPDSSELISQQCKLSAETVAMLKGLQYGNTSIRKDVGGLINTNLKAPENRESAQKAMNRMVDDKSRDTSTLEHKYCS